MVTNPKGRLRAAVESDLDTIIELIHALAEYEREPHAVLLDREELRRHLFGPRPYAEVILAETEDGESAGFALFFHNFSTWAGKPGIHLEDLFVRPEMRGDGYGKALLVELARLALERGLRPARMVGARLERAVHPLLQGARRRRHGRLDRLPRDRGRAHGPCRPRLTPPTSFRRYRVSPAHSKGQRG